MIAFEPFARDQLSSNTLTPSIRGNNNLALPIVVFIWYSSSLIRLSFVVSSSIASLSILSSSTTSLLVPRFTNALSISGKTIEPHNCGFGIAWSNQPNKTSETDVFSVAAFAIDSSVFKSPPSISSSISSRREY